MSFGGSLLGGMCCMFAGRRRARRLVPTLSVPMYRSALAVDWHGTSADGAVTLEPVFCLGLCASGPSALLDGHPVGRLNPARIDRMLETLS